MFLDLLLSLFRRRPAVAGPGESEDDSVDPNNPFAEPVVLEFSDVIDLHSIPPRQVRQVVEDYIEEAHRRGVEWVRIVHGKGVGVQREVVRSTLSRSPFVTDFRDAPPEAGGWGATIVTMNLRHDLPTTDNYSC